MGRVVVSEFVSLDGVVEDPGGVEGFRHGGWSFDFQRGAEGDRFKLDETMDAEAMLLGRRTYEAFAASWPSRSGEFADKFNAMPKYVLSSTLAEPLAWNNSRLLRGDLVNAVSELRSSLGGNIVVHGSTQLAQALIDGNLVDELRLMVFPVILGDGKRLFGATGEKKRWHLSESRAVGEGIVILVYVSGSER